MDRNNTDLPPTDPPLLADAAPSRAWIDAFAAVAVLLTAVVALLFAVWSGPAAADPVAVRVGAHEGFGRVVFDWAAPAPYEADIQGRQATFRFDRPIEADLGPIRRNLARYVSSVQSGTDGRSVTLTLSNDYTVRHSLQGGAVVVDILDPPAAQTPPATASSAATTPAAEAPTPVSSNGPPVSVRTGEHEGFTRIVIDWPAPVGYRVERNGGQVALRFDRPTQFDTGDIAKRPPRYARLAAVDPQASSLTLSVPEGARVRDSLNGAKVVLDIYAPDGSVPATQPAATPPAPAAATRTAERTAPAVPPGPPTAATPAPALPAPAQATPTQIAPAQAAPAPSEAAPAETAAPAPASAPASPPATVAEATPEPQAAPASPAAHAGAPPASPPPALSPPAGPGAPPPPIAVTSAPAPATPPAAAPPTAVPPAALPAPNRPLALTPAIPPAQQLSVSGAPAGGDPAVAANLRFGWNEPVAAALFRRGDALWLVFDKAAPVDPAALRQAGGKLLQGVEQLPVDGATALRLDTEPGVNPAMRRDGSAWILEFRLQAPQGNTAIEVRTQTDAAGGPRVFLPVAEPGRAIAVTDPDAGDNLVVVPVMPLGLGVPQARRFPQFELVETVQGIVVKPLVDDLRVRSLPQGVELTAAAGLAVSTVTPRAQADLRLGALRPLTRVFDLEPWRNLTTNDVRDTRQALQRTLARSGGEDRERRRMELARFYLSMGFQPETLGVLQAIETERPEAANDPEFRAVKGAAQLLLGRLDEAADNLRHQSLDNNDEGDFWRAALKAAEGDLAGAAPAFKRTTGILRPYPRGVKIPVGLLATESAIAVGDVRQAAQVLETLRSDSPSESQKPMVDYEIGRIKVLAGDTAGAVAGWEDVMKGPNRLARAKAALARAELLMKTKQITRKAGIEELEKLRFTWRGDDFEFNLLRRLGELYLAENDFREGLRAWRQAVTNFRSKPAAADIQKQMAQTFADIYLGDRMNDLAPLSAVALYDEFKDLTPTGEKGDAIIRRLADRLVAVDLLDQGAALLDGQVQSRLQGVDKARVGAQLALVRLMAREPDKAVAALRASDVPGVPDDLARQRRQLMARALAGSGQAEDALALLKGDASPDADQLRLEIFWNGQRWAEAAAVLRRVADAAGIKRGVTLSPEQGQILLNMAIAQTLSGNQRGVNRLRDDYLDAMDATPYKEAFRLIASDETQGLADYRTIAGKVKLAENFQGFMAAYKERLKAQNLSGIN